jgi:hypothetical protein
MSSRSEFHRLMHQALLEIGEYYSSNPEGNAAIHLTSDTVDDVPVFDGSNATPYAGPYGRVESADVTPPNVSTAKIAAAERLRRPRPGPPLRMWRYQANRVHRMRRIIQLR